MSNIIKFGMESENINDGKVYSYDRTESMIITEDSSYEEIEDILKESHNSYTEDVNRFGYGLENRSFPKITGIENFYEYLKDKIEYENISREEFTKLEEMELIKIVDIKPELKCCDCDSREVFFILNNSMYCYDDFLRLEGVTVGRNEAKFIIDRDIIDN